MSVQSQIIKLQSEIEIIEEMFWCNEAKIVALQKLNDRNKTAIEIRKEELKALTLEAGGPFPIINQK